MNNKLISNTTIVHEGVQNAIIQANQVIDKHEITVALIKSSVDKIGDVVIQAKQIDQAIKQMDLQVELMLMEYDMRIEKYKITLPLIQNQINTYSNRMDTLLDEILKMDAKSNDPSYIKFRSELISTLTRTSETLSNMFIKFIIAVFQLDIQLYIIKVL